MAQGRMKRKPRSKSWITRIQKAVPKELRDRVCDYVDAEESVVSFLEPEIANARAARAVQAGAKASACLGYGLGVKQSRDKGIQLAVRVYVTRKLPNRELSPSERIPAEINGIPTDVVEIGRVFALAGKKKPSKKGRVKGKPAPKVSPRSKSAKKGVAAVALSSGSDRGVYPLTSGSGRGYYPLTGGSDRPGYPGLKGGGSGLSAPISTRVLKDLCARRSAMDPLQAGVSIGPHALDATGTEFFNWVGTLGYFVRSKGQSGPTYILSNNHVLANWTRKGGASNQDYVPVETDIVQAGVGDDWPSQWNTVAKLTTALEIVVEDDFVGNRADVALAELESSVSYEAQVFGLGKVQGEDRNPYTYQTVVKGGRTTGATLGLLYDLDANIWVEYGQGLAWFDQQLSVLGTAEQIDFSAGGDSGSLVIDYLGSNAVGLLFAGSEGGLTFVNAIEDVLDAFKDDAAIGQLEIVT